MSNADLFEKLSRTDKLAFQDQWRFSLQMILELRNREHEHLQYEAGVLDEETWRSYRDTIQVSLAGRSKYDSYKLMLNDRFRDVNSRMRRLWLPQIRGTRPVSTIHCHLNSEASCSTAP